MAGRSVDVVLFGWAGASAERLRPVERAWRAMGAEVHVAIPHVVRNMALPGGWTAEGKALARRLEAAASARVREGQWVLHAFSNAGFWAYASLLAALGEDRSGAGLRERVALTVLDSAPGFPPRVTPAFTARHATMALLPMLLERLGQRPRTRDPWLTPIVEVAMRAWHHLAPWQVRAMEESLERACTLAGPWPHLLLYGSPDELVPAEHVEAFAERLVATGHDVRRQRWDDSGHVRHFFRHRRAYVELMTGALRSAPYTGR